MRVHPDKKTMIKAILSEDKSNSDILLHVSECEECRTRFNAILAVLESSDNSNIVSSDDLEKRIVRSSREIRHHEALRKTIFPLNIKVLKPVIAAAAVLFIALSSFIIFKNQTRVVPILVSNVKGTVMIDRGNAEQGVKLVPGSEIKTDDQSIAEIILNKQFRIELAENTILLVEKTIFNKKHNIFIFSFNLKKGKIYSEFYHNNQQMEYSFKTPDAVIYSIGTTFLLSVSDGTTDLFLNEGKLKIRSTLSGEEIQSTAGKKYTVAGKITSREMYPDEKTLIDAVKANRGFNNNSTLRNKNCKKIKAKQKTAHDAENIQKNINSLDSSDLENNQRDRDDYLPGQKRRHHPPPHHPLHRPPPFR